MKCLPKVYLKSCMWVVLLIIVCAGGCAPESSSSELRLLPISNKHTKKEYRYGIKKFCEWFKKTPEEILELSNDGTYFYFSQCGFLIQKNWLIEVKEKLS